MEYVKYVDNLAQGEVAVKSNDGRGWVILSKNTLIEDVLSDEIGNEWLGGKRWAH